MKPEKISVEDPRLTAFALGELEPQEMAAMEAAIRDDAAAQEAVTEIRALAKEMENALENEPVEAWAAKPLAAPAEDTRKVTPFPYWILGAAAAACFAFVFTLQQHAGQRAATVATVSDVPAKNSALDSASAEAALKAATANNLSRHLPGVADGFSDVKPATFREDGLKLGKSVAQDRSDFSPSRDFGSAHRMPALVFNRESYAFQPANGFSGAAGFPLSMFSPSEDTSSYRSVASFLNSGRLPPPDAVHVEELLNYFARNSAAEKTDLPVAASIEVAAAPWNPAHRLVRIGVSGGDQRVMSNALTVAKDMKVQVEFNPEQAKSYRLLGYEENAGKTSAPAVQSNEVPGVALEAGHTLTAMYEVVPAEAATVDGDPLRYSSTDAGIKSTDPRHRELLTLKIHYTMPVVDVSRKIEIPLVDTGKEFALASKDFKFDAAVARFGMLLKDSQQKNVSTYDQLLTWVPEGQEKPDDKRHEFINLVSEAKRATVE